MMVAIQWYKLSPLGPAEQSGGGSILSSAISLWILFPEADTEVVDAHVDVDAEDVDRDDDIIIIPVLFIPISTTNHSHNHAPFLLF